MMETKATENIEFGAVQIYDNRIDFPKIENSEKFWNNRGEAVKSMDESLQ